MSAASPMIAALTVFEGPNIDLDELAETTIRDAGGVPWPVGGARAFCTRRDPSGTLLEWSEVTSTPEQSGVAEMVLELPHGECEISVFDRGRTTFVEDLWVRLAEGDIVRMDLHPPVLQLAEPLDGSCRDGSLRVRGTASAPYGVASVETHLFFGHQPRYRWLQPATIDALRNLNRVLAEVQGQI